MPDAQHKRARHLFATPYPIPWGFIACNFLAILYLEPADVWRGAWLALLGLLVVVQLVGHLVQYGCADRLSADEVASRLASLERVTRRD